MTWLDSLPRRERLIVTGLAVLTLAQGLVWTHPTSVSTIAMAGIGSGAPVFSSVASGVTEGPGVRGWHLHPLALVLLPMLLYVHGTRMAPTSWWPRWGRWVTLAAMVYLARVDLSDRGGWGILVGWIGIAIAARGAFVRSGIPVAPAAS